MNIKVQKIQAVELTVTNAEESKNFYTQALGFEPVSDIIVDEKIRTVTLQLGDEFIKLTQYLQVAGKPIPKDSQSNDLWFQHLAIVVSDMDRAYTHLQSFTFEPISLSPQTIPPENQPSAGVRAFKFKDADGHDLELIWFPADKGQDKWHQDTNRLFLGIDHSAIAVANTEESLKFYRDLLGMQVREGSLNQGEIQAHLDGLPGAKVRVTPLRPIQSGMGIELLDYITPANGRPTPSDWQSHDIAHMQFELVVSELQQLIDILKQNNITVFTHQQSYLLKDPNGHSILLNTDG